jgi:hypothetical protein
VEKYNEVIAENPNVELIQVSLDSSEDAAEGWAASNQFPWLTVLPGDVDRSKLKDYMTRNAVPHYSLRTADGEELANGSSAIFRKIAELSDGKSE